MHCNLQKYVMFMYHTGGISTFVHSRFIGTYNGGRGCIWVLELASQYFFKLFDGLRIFLDFSENV